MPGHAEAALAAYPELACIGNAGFSTDAPAGIHPGVYCASNPQVDQFIEGVLTEVLELFPSTYIHVGGDEVPKGPWHNCPRCQAYMKEHGLTDEHELQSDFIRRVDKFLTSKGRRLVGWDEILEGGIAPGATVMSWRGIAGGIAAAKAGHDVVMSPGTHCYFDHYQGDPKTQPKAIGGYTPLVTVYSYEPIPPELSADEAKHILAVQGNLWAEYFPNFRRVEYMTYPRAARWPRSRGQPRKGKTGTISPNACACMTARLDALDVNYFKDAIEQPPRAPGTRPASYPATEPKP